MLAEFGKALRSVFVEAAEYGECRVPEAAFGALTAEAAVEASDGRAQLPSEVGLPGLSKLLVVSCTLARAPNLEACGQCPVPGRGHARG